MKTQSFYPTRPIECWGKMKELRARYFKHIWTAEQRGDPLYIGAGLAFMGALPMGLGDASSMMHGPYFAQLMRDPERAVKCHEASDIQGLSRDLCSTLRLSMGTLYMGFHHKAPSGQEVHPQFVFEPQICIAQSKIAQLFSQEYGIPFIAMEVPFVVNRSNPQEIENARRYFVQQCLDVIDQMKKVTGKEFDDERLIEGVRNQWNATRYWGMVCLQNRNVPAPLDMRMLESFGAMLFVTGSFRPDGVAMMKELYEETQERVRLGIAALPTERCRLLYEGQPVYYRIKLLRYPNRYGATFIGGRFTFCMHGCYTVEEDGSWEAAPTLEEMGNPMRTREDALRLLADHCLLYRPQLWTEYVPQKVKEHIAMARDWNVDGAVYHLDLGCKFMAAGHMEARLAVQGMGLSTMVFEASSSDPRDLSEAQVIDQYEAFLHNLGLAPIETPQRAAGEDAEKALW